MADIDFQPEAATEPESGAAIDFVEEGAAQISAPPSFGERMSEAVRALPDQFRGLGPTAVMFGPSRAVGTLARGLIETPQAQTLRRTAPVRAILGAPAAEREALLTPEELEAGRTVGTPGLADIAGTMFKFGSVPPPAAEAVRATTEPLYEVLPAPVAGTLRGVREVALTMPIAMGAVGLGKNVGRALGGIFTGEFIFSLPEQKRAFDEAVAAKDYGSAAQVATQAIVTGGLLAAGAAHELKQIESNIKRTPLQELQRNQPVLAETIRRIVEEPETGPPGEPLPEPARVAANLAAPGTMRPGEIRAWAPPAAEQPAGMVQFPERGLERRGVFAGPVPEGAIRFMEPPVPIPPTPKVQAETRGKVSFGAPAPTLLRNLPEQTRVARAAEEARAVGLTRAADEAERAAQPAPVAPETVMLYRGQEGAGAGGAFWSSDPQYAASFGGNVQSVQVPKTVAEAARQATKATGSGTPNVYILPLEWSKKAQPMETPPVPKVFDLEAVEPIPVPEQLRLGLAASADPTVLSAVENQKILGSVISDVPVDMVNMLASEQIPLERLSRDPTMFVQALSANRDPSVLRGISNALENGVARLRAKLLFAHATGRDIELSPTLRASDLQPGEVVRLFAPNRANAIDISGIPESGGTTTGTEFRRLVSAWSNPERFPTLATELLNRHQEIVTQKQAVARTERPYAIKERQQQVRGEREYPATETRRVQTRSGRRDQLVEGARVQPAEVPAAGPAQPEVLLTLYRGQSGAGAGGAFWSSDPQYAASFGPNVQTVTVPKSVADAAREAARATGSGTPNVYILPAEWTKRATLMERPPAAKVYDLEAATAEAPAAAAAGEKLSPKGQRGPSTVTVWKAERRVGDVKEGPTLGEFYTDNEQTARNLADLTGAVTKQEITLQNPLEIPAKGEGFEVYDGKELNRILKQAGVQFRFNEALEGDAVWRHIDEAGNRLVAALRQAGYDSIRFPEYLGGKEQTTTLVLKPKAAVPAAKPAAAPATAPKEFRYHSPLRPVTSISRSLPEGWKLIDPNTFSVPKPLEFSLEESLQLEPLDPRHPKNLAKARQAFKDALLEKVSPETGAEITLKDGSKMLLTENIGDEKAPFRITTLLPDGTPSGHWTFGGFDEAVSTIYGFRDDITDVRPGRKVTKPKAAEPLAPVTPEAPSREVAAAPTAEAGRAPAVAAAGAAPSISQPTPAREPVKAAAEAGEQFRMAGAPIPGAERVSAAIQERVGELTSETVGNKSWWRRYFTSAKGLPQQVPEAEIARLGKIRAETRDAAYASRELIRALRSEYGVGPVQYAWEGVGGVPKPVMEQIQRVLTGEADPNVLAEPLRAPVERMRNAVDRLSSKVSEILRTEGKDELAAFIDENMRAYLTRSYRIFDDPKWVKKIPRHVRRAAEDFIAGRLREADPAADAATIQQRAEVRLREMLADWSDSGLDGLLRKGKLGAKDLTIFMHRKDIAPEIRAVLGEYRDPITNYVRTVTKQARFLADTEFLGRVRELGLGRWLFEEGQAPAGFEHRIAAESSSTMAPLNGLRTSPEIARVFSEFNRNPISDTWLVRRYFGINAWTRQAATVFSLLTQARNLLGNPLFNVAAGHWNFRDYGKAFKTQLADIAGSERAAQEFYRDMARHGLVDENPITSELRAAIQDAGLRDPSVEDYTMKGWVRLLKTGQRASQRLYRMSDEMGKQVAWLAEREIAERAFPDMPEAARKIWAAERVRNSYPTYSMLPEWVRGFRKQPLFGPFVPFAYERFRNLGWNLHYGMQDLRSGNAALQVAGAKRMAGTMAVLGAGSALGYLTKYLFGMSDDVEDDVRRFLPRWSKNSQLVWLGKQGTKIRYLNWSYLNPDSQIADAFVAAFGGSNKDVTDRLAGAFSELVSSWTGEQMGAAALEDVLRNQTPDGAQVYNPQVDWNERWAAIAGRLLRPLLPGTVQRVQRRILPAVMGRVSRAGQPLSPTLEVGSEITGLRSEMVDLKSAMSFRARDFVDAQKDARQLATGVLLAANPPTIEAGLEAYRRADDARFQLWQDMHKDMAALLRQGATRSEIVRLLSGAGVSGEDASRLYGGRYNPLMIASESYRRAGRPINWQLHQAILQERSARFKRRLAD